MSNNGNGNPGHNGREKENDNMVYIRKGSINMSNKDMLIVALENAENNEEKVEFCFSSDDGFRFFAWMVPEVLQNGNEVQICDAEFGMGHSLSVMLINDVAYDEEKEEYYVPTRCGTCTICFTK